jgi:hypothetical protein
MSERLAPFATGARSFRKRSSSSRASSPLLFGLAPRGVCLADAIAGAAVGSYPTFSPLPAREPCRHPEGFPAVCHRVTHRRRYFLCGTFREPLPQPPRKTIAATIPLALPGALPTTLLHPKEPKSVLR